ncbi:MAG: cysteine synthase A [Polyangiaceae bacterium]|nr:cysteine synthase A [Polyangiaceae bacterium]
MLYSGIVDVIGETPLVKLERLSRELGVELLAKLESQNPAGSVKDRIARAMVEEAERSGQLAPGATLIEPTSGNTGIALAMLAAARGYRLILTMPEAMSQERVALLRAYGAEVLLTPGTLMRSAVEQAEVLGASTPGAVLLRQFDNPENPRVHERTTAEELWRDLDGRVDAFVAGIGTGGTITGVGRVLKARAPHVRVIGVEPEGAAVLSGGAARGHNIQGIGAGFVPRVLDTSLIDELCVIDEQAALGAARRLARSEGILAGISSGAALAATIDVCQRGEFAGKRVVVVLCDTGERYASTTLFRALTA